MNTSTNIKATPTLSKRLRRVAALSLTGLLIGLLTGCDSGSIRLAPRQPADDGAQPLISASGMPPALHDHMHPRLVNTLQPCTDAAPCPTVHAFRGQPNHHL